MPEKENTLILCGWGSAAHLTTFLIKDVPQDTAILIINIIKKMDSDTRNINIIETGQYMSDLINDINTDINTDIEEIAKNE